MRLAAIDVGSNAIRFMAVRAKAGGQRKILDQVRVPLRLGHDVFTAGELRPATIDDALRAFADFVGRMEALRVKRYRAVATSAVRESRNGRVLVERAGREAGLILEAIDGAEEARLVHLAVRDRIELGEEKSLLVDLGGGSLEISTIDAAGIYGTVSLPLGSVRLLETAGAEASPQAVRELIAQHTAELRAAPAWHSQWTRLIATGGNIEEVVRLIRGRPIGTQAVQITTDELAEAIARVSALSLDQRVTQLGMRADRADVVVPAALVYQSIAEIARAKALLVPFAGVKEGLISDLLKSEAD